MKEPTLPFKNGGVFLWGKYNTKQAEKDNFVSFLACDSKFATSQDLLRVPIFGAFIP